MSELRVADNGGQSAVGLANLREIGEMIFGAHLGGKMFEVIGGSAAVQAALRGGEVPFAADDQFEIGR
ncbi:MAG TPA: hypothetical protein DCS26_05415, partial [Porticoccaceae bacterium]|nr:hypothetical protein [Porticoccaceae bacterium]